MIFEPLSDLGFRLAPAQTRRRALGLAIVFRDRSFQLATLTREQRTCRTLMRGEAMRWRRAGSPVTA